MARLAKIHFTHGVGWLRAAVLGANDGVVSTASLIHPAAGRFTTNGHRGPMTS